MNLLFLPKNSSADEDLSERATRNRAQIGMSTLLLATACTAAWVCNWTNERQIAQLDQRVTAMRSLTQELVVKDRSQISVIQAQPRFYDQPRWNLYVPDDSLGLLLRTRDSSPPGVARLTPGHHVVELRSESKEEQWITQVLVDDQPAITTFEPAEWKPLAGYSTTSHFSEQADLPADRSVELFRRVFHPRASKVSGKPPESTTNGIALWIEKMQSASDHPQSSH